MHTPVTPVRLVLSLLAVLAHSPSLWVCSSYCGPTTIPYSFEALADGQPVLGCARPACFGRESTDPGLDGEEPSFFFLVKRRPDGYFRHTDTEGLLGGDTQGRFKPQLATCPMNSFQSEQCSVANAGHWVGGIQPLDEIFIRPLATALLRVRPTQPDLLLPGSGGGESRAEMARW